MEGLELLSLPQWKPLKQFGINHPFFNINSETVGHTWVMLGILTLFLLVFRYALTKKPKALVYLSSALVKWFVTTTEQTLGFFAFNHFSFVASLFLFIFFASILASFPFFEEPTKDINTTLALGLISFFYTQYYAIKAHGIGSYLKEYFLPFFFMFPLNVIGQLATIVSISFRLFGNIFGGATISHIYFNAVNNFTIMKIINALGFNFIMIGFFGIAEGGLQAFVFAMLTLTYLSIAITQEEEQPETDKAPA